MSHIDEGELTAYADGAWAPEDAEAIRIAAHLDECANCRNRLAQEQALSGRASEILAIAAPVMTGAPTFEEVAARVTPRTHTHRRALPLSWAASVILAVGLGWFGRDALYRPESAAPIQPIQPKARVAEPMVPAAPPPSTIGSAAGVEAGNVMRAREQDASEAKVADMASLAERRDIEYITAAEAENRRLPLRIVPELEVVRVGVLNGAVQVEQKLPDGKIVMVTTRTDDDRANTAAGEARLDAVGGGAVGRAEMSQSVSKQAARAAAPPSAAPAPATAAPEMMTTNSVRVVRGAATLTISGALSADSLRALAAKIR